MDTPFHLPAGGWLFENGPIAWVQRLVGLGHPLPFRALSLLGDTWGIVLVVGLGFWLFGRRALHALVGIVLLGAATKLLLMDLVHQSRPEGPGIVVYERLEVSSFPSGHVFATVGPWGLLYVLGHVRLRVPVAITLAVALGRVYLGTHYLGDVLGGMILGALLVWAYARLRPVACRWLARRGRRFPLGMAALAFVAALAAWAAMPAANPRRYEIYGMVLAAAVALPVESRVLRYRPGGGSWGAGALRVLVGASGVALCLLWDRSRPDGALLLGGWTAGLATLWAVLGAPALLVALGLGSREAPDGGVPDEAYGAAPGAEGAPYSIDSGRPRQ